jgi:tellurite resistance protein
VSKLNLPDFSGVEPERLRKAVCAVVEQQAREAVAPSVGPRSLEGRLPSMENLATDSTRLKHAGGEDANAARHFLAMLEAAYLVATMDGISDAERQAFADLASLVTGGTEAAGLTKLLEAFDATIEHEGRPARLAEVAKSFEDFMAREEALSFAALVVISDGSITRKEARGLIELAEALGYSVGELQAALDQIAQNLKRELGMTEPEPT